MSRKLIKDGFTQLSSPICRDSAYSGVNPPLFHKRHFVTIHIFIFSIIDRYLSGGSPCILDRKVGDIFYYYDYYITSQLTYNLYRKECDVL